MKCLRKFHGDRLCKPVSLCSLDIKYANYMMYNFLGLVFRDEQLAKCVLLC